MSAKNYTLEFAVKAPTEMRAMSRLKALGITNADEAKLSDLDRQAGLFIIKVPVDESELSDVTYKRLLSADDIHILSDELSAKRAQEIIKLTAPVEQQLKKLLICVLPETEKVLNHIIDQHQKHKSNLQPTSRIEWCEKINDFSFGELPKVLEEDIAELAKKQLLSTEGLLSLIASADDFDALQLQLTELSKPKSVWNTINSLLEKPLPYSHFSGQLIDLCNARNEAAHLRIITEARLKEVRKNQKHVLSCIGKTKSGYQVELKMSMDMFSKSMQSILNSAVKIDPSIFTEYQKVMTETFKPFTETISKLQLNIASPDFSKIINQNTSYQTQVMKSLGETFKNMQAMNVYDQLVAEMSRIDFLSYTKNARSEIDKMKPEIDRLISERKRYEGEISNDVETDDDRPKENDEEKND